MPPQALRSERAFPCNLGPPGDPDTDFPTQEAMVVSKAWPGPLPTCPSCPHPRLASWMDRGSPFTGRGWARTCQHKCPWVTSLHHPPNPPPPGGPHCPCCAWHAIPTGQPLCPDACPLQQLNSFCCSFNPQVKPHLFDKVFPIPRQNVMPLLFLYFLKLTKS